MRDSSLGRLLIATHNAGKLGEFRDLLEPLGIEAVSAEDLGLPEPDETGATFLANARLKAEAAASAAMLALVWPDGRCETVEGEVHGTIIYPPRGRQGFGYDPLFLPDGHDRTFGEMTADEKHGIPADGSDALSHRARAFQHLARRCFARPRARQTRRGTAA